MAEPNLIGNAAVIQGDISHPYLGLDRGTYAGLKAGATEVLHAYRVLSQLPLCSPQMATRVSSRDGGIAAEHNTSVSRILTRRCPAQSQELIDLKSVE
jgi:hypothetical protein